MQHLLTAALATALLTTLACEKKTDAPVTLPPDVASAKTVVADKGVDTSAKLIKLGALNDLTGAAKLIGQPYAVGKRILAEQVNAGGSGILPDGWKVELVEQDHGYDPDRAVKQFAEMKDEVLVIATSLGTPNTLPLIPSLGEEKLIVMPASLSSKMAESEFTPPVGPAYFFEAWRAMDWAVQDAGGADKVKAGIVYQNDDYGLDGIHGWEAAADHAGVKVVSQQAIKPGQKNLTAAVTALRDAGANYVLLTVLPGATGSVLENAAQLEFRPKWIGNTAAWSDQFYDPEPLPNALFTNFYLATGLPFWGEPSEGMNQFLDAFEKFAEGTDRDWYTLLSYVQGRAALEAARRAIEAGDITRDGYLSQLRTMKAYTSDGLVQPLDWSKAPYIVSTKTRILEPDFAARSWSVAGDWAAPDGFQAAAEAKK